ncbi:hypothetical protein C8R46DRAFT_1159305 [Mycena filopes]|nr:hypothetical protein C8R46DRAFT_1159305 [Mycena filopes]
MAAVNFADHPAVLAELKSRIEDPLQISIALYREGTDGCILLNIIPESVSGVRRARALVHSRRIGGVFQAHLTSLTVDHLSNLTLKAIKNALASPDSVHVIQLDRGTVEPTPDELGMIAPASSSSPPPTSKGGSMFSLLRRKKKPELEQEFGAVEPFTLRHEPMEQSAPPPPPPPKDKGRRSVSVSQPPHDASPEQLGLQRRQPRELGGHRCRPAPAQQPPRPRRAAQGSRSAPRRCRQSGTQSLWTLSNARGGALSSRGIARLRSSRHWRRRRSGRKQIKLQKEASLREQEEEEEMRRLSLENELRRVTAQRRQRDREEQEAEERKKRELEQKKRLEKERRMEEHRRLEEWRKGQAAQAEQAAQLAEQARRREEEERKKRILLASKKIKNTRAADDIDLFTGWLAWRRRYFKFVGSTMFLYKSLKEKDSNQVVDEVNLRGQVRALREWNEGYEDLKAIPFSFVVEFNGAREPWSMFTDDEQEKYKLLGLLTSANA